MNYAILGLIALVLLAGLVAFGVGHKRWSLGTLIAAFLVLLSATGYLYLASRFAAYEWSWSNFVRGKQVQLARVRDAQVPDAGAGGRLKPLGGDDLSAKPIAELAKEEERWQRALDRIDTWRGRSWTKASFEPPKADGATGKLEIPFPAAGPAAAEGEAPAAEPEKPGDPPLNPGATVYVFEDVPAQEGGRYLGAFSVQKADVDLAGRRSVLTVVQTAPRDTYDAEAWNQTYDSVTVLESLPPDRWLAFSKTPAAADGAAVMPEPKRLSIEQVEELLQERDRQATFLAEVEKHETVTDKEQWKQIREDIDAGKEPPGSYWAVVKFKEPATVAETLDDEEAKRSFEPGEQAEFDLQTAFALADKDTVSIEEVRYRRRLRDAATFIHGSRIFRSSNAGGDADAFRDGISADGVSTLVEVLRRELAALESSTKRLAASRVDVEKEIEATEDRRRRLADDKRQWDRDAAAAERTAGAFDAEVARTRTRLAEVERAIVSHATDLREAIGRLMERIDAAAPAPSRPAATP